MFALIQFCDVRSVIYKMFTFYLVLLLLKYFNLI